MAITVAPARAAHCTTLRPTPPHPTTATPFREPESDTEGRNKSLKIDRYFETGPTVCHWTMKRLTHHWSTPYWRYTLTGWAKAMSGAGFTIAFLSEPRPTAARVAANPHLEDCSRMPFLLMFVLRKQVTPADGEATE